MPPRFSPVTRAAAYLLCLAPALAPAQDPIIKPRTTTTVYRLAAPATVVARQLADGRIEVRWARVDGAVAYRLFRSVPNLQSEQAITPDARDTAYVDSDVKAGYYYYYVLAAVSDAGQLGLKRGAAPVNATISAGTTTATTTTPTAPQPPAPVEARPSGQRQFTVTWYATGNSRSYDVTRWVYRSLTSDPSKMDPVSGRAEITVNVNASDDHRYVDSFAPADYPRWVQYRVKSNAIIGAGSSATSTAQLVPGEATTTPGTTPGTTTTPTSPGGTSVSPTLQASVAVGGSSALASTTGISNAQWVSSDPSVASVSADGTITGRSGGTVSVVAIVPLADGSVRATVVRVTVTP